MLRRLISICVCWPAAYDLGTALPDRPNKPCTAPRFPLARQASEGPFPAGGLSTAITHVLIEPKTIGTPGRLGRRLVVAASQTTITNRLLQAACAPLSARFNCGLQMKAGHFCPFSALPLNPAIAILLR